MSHDPHSPAESGDRSAASATARQFVTFLIDGETYAVPLAEVQEIIRLPEMVDVPLAPQNLAGLANLRGTVLPVTSLRRVFGLPERAHDDATRVVVISQGTPFGFVVDRMASVVTSEPSEIDGTEGLQNTVDTDMLAGIIRRAGGMVMIIDPARLMQRGAAARPDDRRAERADIPAEAGAARAATAVSDEIQLVSFGLAGQEYALPIEHVQEIVQIPDVVSTVPRADASVIGVINLRDRLLPLVSLRTLFGLAATGLSEQSRIVVVSWGGHGVARSVGIVTDTVKEVLRVPRAIVDPLPDLLSGGGALREVEAICRIDQGKRLVSILSAERLFDAATRLEGSIADQAERMEGEPMSQKAEDEEQFVVFRLAGEEYGVPIDAVHEIVRVPEQLTRVPRTPHFIEGVVNLRGAVLPVVDQRRRFQLPDTERNDRQRIMVFLIEGVRTGFIVDAVSEVLKIPRAVIGPAPDLGQDGGGAVDRIANLAEAKRIIMMLDVARLLSRSEVADLRQAA
jgi:purine-binding chemotaxis protein CheW